jgi:hypothetical protein
MLSGRKKKDYAAESAADGLEVQAERLEGSTGTEGAADAGEGDVSAEDPIPEAVAA